MIPAKISWLSMLVGIVMSIGLTGSAQPSASSGHEPSIWLTADEIAQLPAEGARFDNVKRHADSNFGDPDISTRNTHGARTYAAALLAARLDSDRYRQVALRAIRDVIEKSTAADALAACRKLVAYPIAADILQLPDLDPDLDARFRKWLHDALRVVHPTGGGGKGSVITKHEERPNNVGTHCGASRLAASAYLGDTEDVKRAAAVWRTWMGEGSTHNGFRFRSDFTWHADPDNPLGINPTDATKDESDIGGVLPDDQRRCGSFKWPPCKTNYVWEALQGTVVASELLHRAGYDAWSWGDRAVLRAVDWLHRTTFDDGNSFPAEGDDRWQPWLINYASGSDYPAVQATQPGKNLGFTDWTHGDRRASEPAPPAPEPTEEPDPEPTEEPDPEPTEEPDPEPTEEPDPEPTEEPDPEPDPEPSEEPDPEPTEEPDPEPPAPEPDPDDDEGVCYQVVMRVEPGGSTSFIPVDEVPCPD